MEKACQKCSSKFEISPEDLRFYQKVQVPPPTFCPDCRFQRRCSYINVRNFFPRKLAQDLKSTISMYSQDIDLNIVSDELWWSDHFDFFSYGCSYNFETPFFLQFNSLLKKVPLPHLQRSYTSFENSDFCNAASNLKNCYLIINADNSENCMYGFCVEQCRDCHDISFTSQSELCFECLDVKACYECVRCKGCEGCNNLFFCEDCVSCKNCFGCIGLRQKEYHIFNKAYSKEQYLKEISSLDMGSWQAFEKARQRVRKFQQTIPRKFMHERNNQNVSGDYIYQSKNVNDSYLVELGENCKYSHFLRYLTTGTHDAYDYTMFGLAADQVYETAWCGIGIHNIKFCLWNYGGSNLEYCIGCHYSNNLFGCIGLRHKEYCILNKQYSKDEYTRLVSKIKEQMTKVPYVDSNGHIHRYGEFFPTELSPFKYNQSLAQDFCSLSEKECQALHYGWHDAKAKKTGEALSWKDIPDNISQINDEILSKTIECKDYSENPQSALEHNCSQFFRYTAQELKFYKKMNLPLPRQCQNSRHCHRLKQLNPFKTWRRKCDKCDQIIQTTYSPNSPEVVYCGECYLSSVY